MTRELAAMCLGALIGANAMAEEVRVDVTFANGFDPLSATVFRMGELALRDPHLFFPFAGFCIDSTEALNEEIQSQLDADEDSNGFYDASAVAVFKPLETSGFAASFGNQDGQCTTAQPSQCTPGVEPAIWRWYRGFDVSPPTLCMGALAGTTSGYDPPVPAISGSCFATTAIDAEFALSTLTLPLWDTQSAGPMPATTGSTPGNLMRGFLREADADEISIDLGTGPVVLSSVLPGGTGSCATGDPEGMDTYRGESGWWMYLEFRLDAVSSSGF